MPGAQAARRRREIHAFSREPSFSGTMSSYSAATAAVLLGTLYPLFLDALNRARFLSAHLIRIRVLCR